MTGGPVGTVRDRDPGPPDTRGRRPPRRPAVPAPPLPGPGTGGTDDGGVPPGERDHGCGVDVVA